MSRNTSGEQSGLVGLRFLVGERPGSLIFLAVNSSRRRRAIASILKRRCPPTVFSDRNAPSSAQRFTVASLTCSRRPTSLVVKVAFAILALASYRRLSQDNGTAQNVQPSGKPAAN